MGTIKTIKIDPDKCSGCRLCEAICSSSHAEVRYGMCNPLRSRIRIFRDEENDVYLPIFSGPFTDVECLSRRTMVIKGKDYSECTFCPAACPSRSLFKEPGSDIALKCDMCEQLSLSEPLCVQYCLTDALTYVEREEKIKQRPLDR